MTSCFSLLGRNTFKYYGQNVVHSYSTKIKKVVGENFLLSRATEPYLRNKVAFTDYNGENHTFGELAKKSFYLGKELKTLVPPHKPKCIAFLCDRDFNFVTTLASILSAQHIAVPLSATHPDNMLEYFLRSTSTKLVVTNKKYADRLNRIAKTVGSELLIVDHDSFNSEVISEEAYLPSANLLDSKVYNKDSGALILFTSGTTGKPKGVLLTHGNLEAQVENICGAWGIKTDEDCMLHVLPLHHTHGIIHALLSPLAGGARCHMLKNFDAAETWKVLLSTHQSRPTLLTAVPTVFVKLIEEYENTFAKDEEKVSAVRKICKDKMRIFLSGSASLPVPILEKFEQLSGHRILERYGMTETGLILCNPLKNGQRKPGFVGTPLETSKIMVANLSAQSKQGSREILVVGDNKTIEIKKEAVGQDTKITGDLLVKGPSVFKGYWENPEATKKEFTEDGWFITGDTVEYFDGSFKVLGRKSIDIIKSGGYKLSALEIEAQLLSLKEVKEVAVLGIQDSTWGQKVAALIVWTGTELSINEFRDLAKTKLANYACPSVIKTVPELPKNHLGKVNKKELAKLFS